MDITTVAVPCIIVGAMGGIRNSHRDLARAFLDGARHTVLFALGFYGMLWVIEGTPAYARMPLPVTDLWPFPVAYVAASLVQRARLAFRREPVRD